MYGNTLYKMYMNICYTSIYQKKGANERLSLRPCKGVIRDIALTSLTVTSANSVDMPIPRKSGWHLFNDSSTTQWHGMAPNSIFSGKVQCRTMMYRSVVLTFSTGDQVLEAKVHHIPS
jgi:hypothetical protein